MTSQDDATRQAAQSVLPLFYRRIEPLSTQRHAGLRLMDGDASFASATPYVPIVVGELSAAARDYPVVFAPGSGQPLAILALEQTNLFVEDGRWQPDSYVPAYVRRYPFAFVATGKEGEFALAIDAGSDRVTDGGKEGTALFEDGKPSALTQQALTFCNAFQSDAAATAAFGEALKAQDLLVDRSADATLPDGRKLGLNGFQIVDTKKFAELEGDVIAEWHRKGWLGLVHFHLASLTRFRALLDRQALRSMKPSAPADNQAIARQSPASEDITA